MWVAFHGNAKLAEILLASGAKVDMAGRVSLFQSCYKKIVKLGSNKSLK